MSIPPMISWYHMTLQYYFGDGTVILQYSVSIISVNIALKKAAYQTGEWQGLSAGKAVDGNLDRSPSGDYYKSVCAHPEAPTNSVAKWWVDLGATYTINTVTIYNTYD